MQGSTRENYLVRIYRRDKEEPERIAGMVELIEAEEKKTFATFDDLRAILVREQATKRKKTSEQVHRLDGGGLAEGGNYGTVDSGRESKKRKTARENTRGGRPRDGGMPGEAEEVAD